MKNNANNNLEVIIYQGKNGEVKLNADFSGETIWATQSQIADVFDIDRTRITRHIANIFTDKEVDEKSNVRKTHFANSDKPVNLYSLDIVLAVGYRTNSKQAIKFRQWATKILKEYMLKGVAVNKTRLEQLKQTIEIISRSENIEISGVANILKDFTSGLDLLDNYDYQTFKKPKGTKSKYILTYNEAREVINSMKFNEKSTLFGNEKDESFQSALGAIYQTFSGREVYPSTQEKAANLLYLITKNHAFSDGNKRIAAALFIYFLNKNKILRSKTGRFIIDNNTLAAMTLMIALSKPAEKEQMVLLVMNFLEEKRKYK
jgi:prophage maintenance system killer protein/prophage antirepressor-like protein